MKKLVLTAALLLSVTAPSWAIIYIIDFNGSGSVTYTPPAHWEVDCAPAAGCCGSITIECSVQNTPQAGDPTEVTEYDGTPENPTHRWTGEFQNMNIQTSAARGTTGTIELSNVRQDY